MIIFVSEYITNPNLSIKSNFLIFCLQRKPLRIRCRCVWVVIIWKLPVRTTRRPFLIMSEIERRPILPLSPRSRRPTRLQHATITLSRLVVCYDIKVSLIICIIITLFNFIYIILLLQKRLLFSTCIVDEHAILPIGLIERAMRLMRIIVMLLGVSLTHWPIIRCIIKVLLILRL